MAFAIRPGNQQLNGAGSDKTPSAKVVSVLKSRLAEAAKRHDLKVSWDTKRGTPVSVSGDDLLQDPPVAPAGKGPGVAAAPDYALKAVKVMGALAGIYGIQDAGKEFTVRSLKSSGKGYSHVRLDQTYKGLPVFGGQVVVHFDEKGTARAVHGSYLATAGVAILPKISPDEAVAAAMADQKAMGKNLGVVTEGPKLVIYGRGASPVLAYQLLVAWRTRAETGRWRYWIDAVTGGILLRYNDVPTAAPGAGTPAVINGDLLVEEGGANVNINGLVDGASYYLYSHVDLWFLYNEAISDYVYRGTQSWGASDRTVISAGYNCMKVQEYFKNRGWIGVDGAGMMLWANVHKTGEANAYWDGSSINFFDELPCALDVVGHEVTHGVDEFSAGLIYADESGALNESFSDIFGTLIEFYAQLDGRASYPNSIRGRADWLMGEDTAPAVGVIRDMRNPQSKKQPSKYKGKNWDPGGEVHQNDGVQNFFFYLLCEGGKGTNDGIAYNLSGVGTDAGGKIAFLTLMQYMTPGTDYNAARDAWLGAAEELDARGETTNAAVAVRFAWTAVGIGNDDYVMPSDPFVSSGDPGVMPYLASNKVYSLVNPTTNVLNWGFAPVEPKAWLNISTSSLVVASGEIGSVELSINQEVATNLPVGVYRVMVAFTNDVGIGNTTREAILKVANNYKIKSAEYRWVDPVAASHTALTLGGGTAAVDLPFSFRYYDILYSNVYVSPYGALSVDPAAAIGYNNAAIPTYGSPNGLICPLWSAVDGTMSPGTIYCGLDRTNTITHTTTNVFDGVQTNQVDVATTNAITNAFVVTWLDVPYRTDPSAKFSFQVLIPNTPAALSGTNNDIVMQYKDVAETSSTLGSGRQATIGVEDELGIMGRQYSYNGQQWVANERALRFTQNPASDTTKPQGMLSVFGPSGTTVTFDLKLSEPVSGLDASDIVLVGSTVPGISVGTIAGGGLRYHVNVDGVAALGRVVMTVLADAVADTAAPANSNASIGPVTYVVPIREIDFSDDMEGGGELWTASTQVFASVTSKAWEWGVPDYLYGPASAASGTHCWGTVLTNDYPDNMDAWVVSPPIYTGPNPVLDFNVWYSLQYWDGPIDFGYVEAYDGAGWFNVTPGGVYAGESGGVESDGWIPQTIPLDNSRFGNRTIRIRFRATSDDYGTLAGMYVDDVRVRSEREPGIWLTSMSPTNSPAGAAGTNVAVTFSVYNSSNGTIPQVTGFVSSPSKGLTEISGNPQVYGTIAAGDIVTSAAPVVLHLGAVGNFDSSRVILAHEARMGSVGGNTEDRVFTLDDYVPLTTTNLLTVRSTTGVTNWLGAFLGGNGGPTSCLFQVIDAGTNGTNDPPLSNGQVTGDDRILFGIVTGDDAGRFGEGGVPPNVGEFKRTVQRGPGSNYVYVRAWDAASFEAAVAYGDSALYAMSLAASQTNDFRTWPVGAPLQYGRDSNGDSLPDGWCVLNGRDPRLPIQPLGSRTLAATAVSGLSFPNRVAVSSNFVFIADTGNNRVQVWDRMLTNCFHTLGGTTFNGPAGIAVTKDGSRVAVADTGNCRIKVYDVNPLTGSLSNLFQFGSSGSTSGAFNRPMDVAFDGTGQIYVADSRNSGTCNNRVQVFDASGNYLMTIGTVATGTFNRVLGVGLGADGTVYAADSANNRVLAISAGSSSVAWSFGAAGTNAGQFQYLWDAEPGLGNLLYVPDFNNNRIQILNTASGPSVAGIITNAGALGNFSMPQCAAPAPDGSVLYVADTYNNRVLRLQVVVDEDADGIDDVWEFQHGLSPTNSSDALVDTDGDGVSNIGEFRAGTDPNQYSTDGDPAGDGWELATPGMNPVVSNTVPAGIPALLSLAVSPASPVRPGDPFVITATFSQTITNAPSLSLNGAVALAATPMTGSGTSWSYSSSVPSSAAGVVNAALSGAIGFNGYLVDPPLFTTNTFFTVTGVELRITALGMPTARLVWPALSGEIYRVQYCTNLILTNWMVGAVVTSDVSSVTYGMTNLFPTVGPVQFMRVQRILP